MANNILLKKSSVASKTPTTADLDYGELALNYADGALYYKTSGNVIARLNPPESIGFANVAVTGQSTLVADTATGTLTIAAGGAITLTTNSGTDTLTIAHTDTSSVANLSSTNTGGTVIQSAALTFDTYGHVQTASVTTTNLDTRYLQTESDTLATVTTRGATTTNAITVGGLTVNGNATITGDLDGIDSLTFDTTATEANAVGKLYWNANDGTLSFGLVGGNSINHIGQHLTNYVYNDDTTTIAKGEVVYLFAAHGNRASVKKASNASEATSSKTLGVASENIAPGAVGFVVSHGVVDGLSLGAYNPGDLVYLGNTPGTITATLPVAPNHTVFVGVVARANNGNGQLFVKVNNGLQVDELHDVQISGLANNDSLFYNSSTFVWQNTSPTNARTKLGLGTIATQNANSVAITGGAIDGTPVGATTPSTGKFTTLQTTGNVTVGGNLTVSGTTTTVSAQNLSIADNLIYLNDGSTNTNPDLGFAGNYNDGSYRHTGFFRDATDGYWKVFKNYTPEPDASIYIDTSHASFALADIQAANFRGALVGNATTASTLAGTPTINGVTFNGGSNITVTANTTNALTIGAGLSGTSFNGSAAVTITVDNTVARVNDTLYVGTTAIALNRASAAQPLTGIDGITGGTTGVAINAGGSNQSITLTPSGTGVVSVAGTVSLVKSEVNTNAITTALNYLKIQNSNSGGTYIGALEFYTWDNRRAAGIFAERNSVDGTGGTLSFAYSTSNNSFTEGFRLTSAGKLLLGTTTTTTNGGRFQLASHTTTDGGIGFGDIVLHRASAGKIRLAPPDGGSGTVAFELYNASGNAFRMLYGYPYAPVLHADDALTVTSATGSITFKSNNATTLTLDTSNNATLVGNLTVQGTGNSSIAGNLGVGTTSPTAKVDVYGGASATPQTYILARAGSFTTVLGAQDSAGVAQESFVGSLTNNDFKFKTNSTEYMRLTAAGNFGIGTASPSQKLDVSGNIALSTGGYIYGDTTTPYLRLNQTNGTFLGYSANSVLSLLGSVTTLSAGSNYLGLITNGSERMRITNTGNVGIGATAPSSTLEIRSSSNARLTINRSGAWAGSPADIKFNTDDAGTDYWTFGMVADSTNNIRLKYNASEYLTILTNGNTGIGTPTPARKLDVNGDANIGTNLVVGTAVYASQYIAGNSTQTYWKSSTSGILLTLLENGNFTAVGTGTFQGSNVTVDGSSYSRSVYSISGTGKTEIGYGPTGYGFGGRNTGSYISYKDYLYIGTGAANAPTITILESGVGGNVGIGTAFPSYKLHVMGDARMGANGQRLYFYDDGNAHIHSTSTPFWINAEDNTSNIYINHQYNGGVILTKAGGGNVGIGEASPTQKLHVTGNARITGAIYDSANSAGTNGQVLTSTGTGTAWSSSGVAVSGTGTAGKIAKWSATTALADSVITESSGNIGIDTTPTQKLDVNGNIGWSTDYVLSSSTITTTSTTANQVITSVAATSFRTFKFIIQATDATAGKYQSQEILAVHNGSTVAHTEYTAINVGGAVATYDVDISGSTVRLLCTPLSANSTVFKVSMQLIKV